MHSPHVCNALLFQIVTILLYLMCSTFVGMNTNKVVKIQRSEQQLPSVSSQTHSESSSVHTSKINEEETSKRNKQYLGEIGGETNTLTKVLGYYRCIKCTWITFCCRYRKPSLLALINNSSRPRKIKIKLLLLLGR